MTGRTSTVPSPSRNGDAAADASLDVVAPAGALAQVWRGTANQARLGQALEKARVGQFDAIAMFWVTCHQCGSTPGANPPPPNVIADRCRG